MTITKITYDCSTESMGDTSETEAKGYRAWVKTQIEAEFPGVDVTVTDKHSENCVHCDSDADDADAIERLHACVQHAWDSCNWEWV
jgi:hypothetical protein